MHINDHQHRIQMSVKVSITAKLHRQSRKIHSTSTIHNVNNKIWSKHSGDKQKVVLIEVLSVVHEVPWWSLLAPDGSSPWQHFSVYIDIVTILGDISQTGITFRNILQMMSARTALEITLLSERAHNWIVVSSFQMPAWFSLRRPHTHFPFYYVVYVHKSQPPELGNKCVYVSWSRNKLETNGEVELIAHFVCLVPLLMTLFGKSPEQEREKHWL